VSNAKLKGELERVMEVTQITDVADRLIKHLSKGYKQRVGIAQAILGDPEIVILDEPTVGLDPRQIIEIRSLIQQLGESHTVILSSHILSEVRAVCQTILIISKGKLVACDTPENLERLFAGTTTVDLVTEATQEEARDILAPLPYITALTIREDGEGRCAVRVETDQPVGDAICRDVFFAFSAAQRAILQMTMAKASLEDVFMELTSGEPAPEGEEQSPTEEPAPAKETEQNEEEVSQDAGSVSP
jgi:ABC-2 type transport system ATP-binding protein